MLIRKIQVRNFRSIRDSGIIENVTKIFALIGRNNAGKSSFLKAIQIAFDERAVDVHDFHKDTTDDIEVFSVIEKASGDAIESKELRVVIAKESLKPTYYVNGDKKTKTQYKAVLPELLCISDIRNPKDSMTSDGNRTTLLKQILKQRKNDDGDEFAERFSDLSRQMNELKTQESTAISQTITEKFRDVVGEPSFSINIAPIIDLEKGISYRTGITDQDIPDAKSVDILNSGTGLQSMYLLSLLEVYSEMSVGENEAILIIEEPEVYLHPTFQRRMFAALRRIAEQNQVIFTTHSPIMIADIWLTESVRQIRLENGETRVESVKIEDVIDELGIRYEDVLNPKLVVFVEGKDDIAFYEKLGITDPKIRIIWTDSFRAIHYYAFIKIISSEHVKNEFVLIADSDGELAEERVKKLKEEVRRQFKAVPQDLEEKLTQRILILDKYAIESYLLKEGTLIAAFPEIDPDSIRAFLSQYEAKYTQKLKDMRENRLSVASFRQYLKPSAIFEKRSNGLPPI